jgi:hypothetical protein
VRAPQLAEAGRHPRHSAGRRTDGVVDEFLPERHLEPEQLRAPPVDPEPRDGAEEVEAARLAARCVPVDRVPAAEKAGHHRLGHAGGEAGRDGRIRRRSARLEHLQARLRRCRMTGCNPRNHAALLPYCPTVGPAGRVLPCAPRGADGITDQEDRA